MDTEAYAYRTIGVLAAGNRIAACTHSRPPKTCARTMGLGTWGSDSHFRGAQTINAEYREPVDLGSAKPLDKFTINLKGYRNEGISFPRAETLYGEVIGKVLLR